MSRTPPATASVAASLGLPTRYAHLIPLIFGACEGLGSSHSLALALLRHAQIGPAHRVLELACGKGACAVAIARELGATVRGIDACDGFVREASARARTAGVARSCRFESRDLNSLGHPSPRYDAVVMIGLLGHESAPSVLRAWTRAGGVYLFDDAIPRHLGTPRSVIRAAIEALGDTVVAGREISPASLRARIRRDLDLVREGTRLAGDSFPRLRKGLNHWFTGFTRASRELAAGFRTGLWLVRKGPPTAGTRGF